MKDGEARSRDKPPEEPEPLEINLDQVADCRCPECRKLWFQLIKQQILIRCKCNREYLIDIKTQ